MEVPGVQPARPFGVDVYTKAIPGDLFRPPEVIEGSNLPIKPDQYALPAASADVGGMLFGSFRGAADRLHTILSHAVQSEFLTSNRLPSIGRYLLDPILPPGDRASPGGIFHTGELKSDTSRELIFAANSHFHRHTGAIILPPVSSWPFNEKHGPGGRLVDFFCKPGRTTLSLGKYQARGANYYVAIDKERPTNEKLDVISSDVHEVIKIMRTVDQSKICERDFWMLLGALDYAKVHFLTLYNALTFEERRGNLSQDVTYHEHRSRLFGLAQVATETYFKFMLGLDIGRSPNRLREAGEGLDQSIEYLRSLNLDGSRFKIQEIDHPMVLLLNAFQNARNFPDTEIIVALPFGGLQPGLVTKLAFSRIHGRENMGFIPVPLSTHGGSERRSNHLSISDIRDHILRKSVVGKNVLVTEDNSNTGRTAQIIHDALKEAGAASIHVSIVETDPIRVLVKQVLFRNPELFSEVVNLEHPDFDSAIRILPIRRRVVVSGDSSKAGVYGTPVTKEHAKRILARFHSNRSEVDRPDPSPEPRAKHRGDPKKEAKPDSGDPGSLRLAV